MKHRINMELTAQDLILRDYLAFDRTKLANERTILSYLRTSIMLFATGITLIKVLSDEPHMRILGIIFIPLSIFLGLFGLFSFFRTRARMRYHAPREEVN